MSSEDDWLRVSNPEEPVRFSPLASCTATNAPDRSAIDTYYEHSRRVILLGTPQALTHHPGLDRLMLLGMVSGVETYFRSILTNAITICPICRDHVREHQLSFGAVDYYGSDMAAMGLFEQVSFATPGVIEKWTDKVAGVTVEKGSSLRAALDAFQSVCHMRHASVHQAGELTSGNARALGLEPRTRYAISMPFGELQTVGKVCLSIVRAYNQFLFDKLVRRWIDQGRLTGVWADDKNGFRRLFGVFSCDDAVVPTTAYGGYRRLLPRIVSATSARASHHT